MMIGKVVINQRVFALKYILLPREDDSIHDLCDNKNLSSTIVKQKKGFFFWPQNCFLFFSSDDLLG